MISCASKQDESPFIASVYVTNRTRYVLLPPACIETPLDMVQQISGTYGGREFVMNAWVKADETQITMALLNSFGGGMGDLSFREEGLSFSSPYLPQALKPEYIVADFQFCFYQSAALAGAFKNTGLTWRSKKWETGEGECREFRFLFDGESPIFEIEKAGTFVSYTNHLRGYSYILEGGFR